MNSQTTTLHFKSNKDVIIAAEAEAEFEAAGWKKSDKGWKRPSVEAVLPALEQEDVVGILEKAGVGLQYLLSVLNGEFYTTARAKIQDIITANPIAVITAETVTALGLDWDAMAADFIAVANETRSTGIAKEVWDDFEADYITVMLREMPENGEERIKNAAAHIKARFQKCRSNKGMVRKLQTYLAVWFASTANQEDFARVFETLNSRADTLLAANDEDSI